MLSVETRHAIHPDHAKQMDTASLREHFLAQGLLPRGRSGWSIPITTDLFWAVRCLLTAI